MSMTLVEALQQVDLEGGRTYHCQVNNLWVEVRVLDASPARAAPLDLESDTMLDAWTDLPRPPVAGILESKLMEPRLPDVPDIPADEDDA